MYSRNKCYIKKIRPNIFQLVIQKKAIMKAYLKHSSPVNRYNCYFFVGFFPRSPRQIQISLKKTRMQ